MPTYEYKCTNDGSTFDLWQEVGTPAPDCPDCGAPTKKVFQPPRIIFKGAGFYLTDKRAESGGQKTEAKSEDKAEKTEAASSETKTESKTETKTEAPKTETSAPKAGS